MGLIVVLNEISADISNFLKFDANFGLGSGVGPLSGKAILAILAFLGLLARPRTCVLPGQGGHVRTGPRPSP